MLLIKISYSLKKKLTHKVHTRKSDDNNSSYNSYETSDSNFIADKNLTKICLLLALYNHCVSTLQLS